MKPARLITFWFAAYAICAVVYVVGKLVMEMMR